MANIILYLLKQNQQLILTINYLLSFITKYIPLKQFIHDDSVSPEYQKFKVDKLPIIKIFEKQDYTFLLEYYLWKYHKALKPVQ
ncbi:MAG: transposase, partial [Anaerovoracaceae bacterium]